jgi:hypothetical protein
MPKKSTPRSLKASLATLLLGLLALFAERLGLLGGGAPTAASVPQGSATPTASAPQSSAATTAEVAASGQSAASAQGAAAGQGAGGVQIHGLPAAAHAAGLAKVKNAFQQRLSDVLIEGSGRIVHLLPDDEQGSRHQLFLVELEPGLTLKISHNIDLAPYVPVERGDSVAFFGEYEWNEKGGVIHWTHHDPAGRHPDGWLLHEGRTYR